MLHSKSVILKVVLISFVSSNHLNTSLRERIPYHLQEICPGTGVCLNDIIDPDNDLPSCCGACSCSEDCEVNGNCCFPNKDNETIANSRLSSRYHSECLYPITNNKVDAFAFRVYQSYYMISSTAKDTISYETDNKTATSCGEVKVAPWGSMYPVYSKTTGKIYKNSVCADSHNITDGELWIAHVFCHRLPDEAFSSRLQSGSFPDSCHVTFLYTGGMPLIKSEICYHGEHYVGGCALDSFDIPASFSLSSEEITASCESGLISPYRNVYANVFCFLCLTSIKPNNLRIKDQDECIEDMDDDSSKKSGFITFSMIFDGSDISGKFIGIVQTDYAENDHVACPTSSTDQTGEVCRAISCPLGQLLSPEGGCFFPGSKWYTNGFTVIIELSSVRTINISTLFNSIQNLKSPWPSSWTVFTICYKVTDVPMQTHDIVVIQYIQLHSPFNPRSYIPRVHRYISKPWLLKTNNETILLQSVISRKSMFQKPVYNRVYMSPDDKFAQSPQRIMLTKLHFCDHVSLLPSEYLIGSNVGLEALFNLITNNTLHDLEHTIDENGNGVVCLEDSGFYRVASNNAIKITVHMSIVHCLAIIYMILIF